MVYYTTVCIGHEDRHIKSSLCKLHKTSELKLAIREIFVQRSFLLGFYFLLQFIIIIVVTYIYVGITNIFVKKCNLRWKIIQVASAVCSNSRSCTEQYDFGTGNLSQSSRKGPALTRKINITNGAYF